MRRLPAMLAIAALAACNAISGVGDLEVAACAPNCGDQPTTTDAGTYVEAGTGVDASGAPPCDPGQSACGGVCVATNVDDANCGTCGHACAPGTACAGGACLTSCAGGVECPSGNGTVCVDPKTDPTHCGSCTKACGGGESCVNGACVVKLTVAVTRPAGSTSIVTSSVGGISCPGTCTADLPPGTSVKLTATSQVGDTLVEWTSACTGRDPTCTLPVTAPTTVNVAFGTAKTFLNSSDHIYPLDQTAGTLGTGVAMGGGCANGIVSIGDIAIDRHGNAFALARPTATSSALYAVDLTTGACGANAIGATGPVCRGATFAPNPNDPTKDTLYCGAASSLVSIDTTTGARTTVGNYGGPNIAGDLVYVPGAGMFITVLTSGGALPDGLGSVNQTTGAVTLIGSGGHHSLTGLGQYGGKILSCSADGTVSIDPATGASTVLSASTIFGCLGGASTP
jgi:hypothetical protein